MGSRSPFTRIACLSILLAGFNFGCAKKFENPREAAAIKAIQKLGGKVEFDAPGIDQRVVKVYLHDTKVQDADLEPLKSLPRMKNLFLGKTEITDDGLKHLEGSVDLVTLSLNSTRVTNAGLKSLAKLSKLKTLNVQETKITAKGAGELKKAVPELTIAR